MREGPRATDAVAALARPAAVTGRCLVTARASVPAVGMLEGPRLPDRMARLARARAVLVGRLVTARATVRPSRVLEGPRRSGAVARRALSGAVLLRRRVAIGASCRARRVGEDEPGPCRVAGPARDILARPARIVLRLVTRGAAGPREVMAARAADLDVTGKVVGPAVDLCGARVGERSGPASREHADCGERRCAHGVSRRGVAGLTGSAGCVIRMVEAPHASDDLLVAASAASVRDDRRFRQGEGRLALEVDDKFPRGHELVLQARGRSRVDVATDAGHILVGALVPRAGVGTHLVAGRGAERRVVGGERRRQPCGHEDNDDECCDDREARFCHWA